MTTTAATHGEKVEKGNWVANDFCKYDFSFSNLGQETTMGCWLACFKMIYQWANESSMPGRSVSVVESQLMSRGGFSADKLKELKDQGLQKADRATARVAMDLKPVSRQELQSWNIKTFIDRLDHDGPYLWTSRKKDGNFHALLIRGASQDSNSGSLDIIDPWDDTALTRGSGPYHAFDRSGGWSFKMFMGSLPTEDDTFAKQDVLMYLGKDGAK